MLEKRQIVFVFGAGASVHAGGPLAKEFLYQGMLNLSHKELYPVTKESYFLVFELIDKLYGTTLESEMRRSIQIDEFCLSAYNHGMVNRIYFEDLLSFVDLESNSKSHGKWLPHSFEDYRKALHDFIFETIQVGTTHGDSVSFNPDGTKNHHRNCYDLLIDYGISLSNNNCFITFNYDLLLDGAVSLNNPDLLGDYHLPFSKISNYPGYERFLNGSKLEIDVDILKLHGSLNWAHCPECLSLSLAYYIEYSEVQQSKCSECGANLEPVLIPPTYRKDIKLADLRNLWKIAENAISYADEIVIVGYSFPEADLEAKWLFLRSLAKTCKKPTLLLVEPSDTIRNRISSLLKGNVSEINYCNCFEDYCSKFDLPENFR